MLNEDECLENQLKFRSSGLAMAEQQPGIKLKRVRNRKLRSALPHKKPEGWLDGVAKANKAGKVCCHCKNNIVNRPRGLCWTCYYKPGVRDLYPSSSKYARRGVGNFSRIPPLPAVPTLESPGTEGKLKVMEKRAAAGLQIFHPTDARYENDPVTIDWLAEYARRGFTVGVAA